MPRFTDPEKQKRYEQSDSRVDKLWQDYHELKRRREEGDVLVSQAAVDKAEKRAKDAAREHKIKWI
jgi:hypothetical protein